MIPLLFAMLRTATPLLFAGLGGMFSERGGVVNIALEGILLVGAFAAAAVNYATGSLWLTLLAAVAAPAAALVLSARPSLTLHWGTAAAGFGGSSSRVQSCGPRKMPQWPGCAPLSGKACRRRATTGSSVSMPTATATRRAQCDSSPLENSTPA